MKQNRLSLKLIAVAILLLGFASCELDVNGGSGSEKGAKVEGSLLVGWEEPVKGKIRIPSGVTVINEKVFRNCDELTGVVIPGSVKKICDSAFDSCKSLKSVEFSDVGLKIIENSAFYGCTSLVSIEIPEGTTSIGWRAFSGCESLSTVKIPDSVTSIEEVAFENCISLTDLSIGNGIESIKSCTFKNCVSLTSVTIPNSVRYISGAAFYECAALKTVHTVGKWQKYSNNLSTPEECKISADMLKNKSSYYDWPHYDRID